MSKYSSFKEHQLITENWRRFLNEGDTPGEGEAMEEGFFDAVGDLASRTGVFGKKDKKLEFWRRKGQAQAEKHLSNKNVKDGPRFKAAIRDIKRQYLDNDEHEANALGVGDAARAYSTGVKTKAADQAALEKRVGAETEKSIQSMRASDATAREDRKSAAAKAKRQAGYARAAEREEKKRKASEKYDWEQGAHTRSQSGAGAGSSTDRSRRRNRGEI